MSQIPQLFVVFHEHGPAWDRSRSMEAQEEWEAHAAFMDDLVDDGFIALGGPLEGAQEAMLVVRAADREEAIRRLAPDPWKRSGLLVVRACWPWRIRLGAL
jgi:uncharacterized protein